MLNVFTVLCCNLIVFIKTHNTLDYSRLYHKQICKWYECIFRLCSFPWCWWPELLIWGPSETIPLIVGGLRSQGYMLFIKQTTSVHVKAASILFFLTVKLLFYQSTTGHSDSVVTVDNCRQHSDYSNDTCVVSMLLAVINSDYTLSVQSLCSHYS